MAREDWQTVVPGVPESGTTELPRANSIYSVDVLSVPVRVPRAVPFYLCSRLVGLVMPVILGNFRFQDNVCIL